MDEQTGARQKPTTTREPRREDQGDLIVLHLYGSYRDMGRQHVELLGPLAREVYALNRADWDHLLDQFGTMIRLADLLVPRVSMLLGPRYDKSGLYKEIAGMADGLGVSAADGWRGLFGVLGGGLTTTFLATRTATADGAAIIGKNSDWSDGNGLRRPVVSHYHPTNGDLAHVMATWPLLSFPVVGVNEAGFALGLNFFNADQVLGLGLPQWPWRRALQTARSVDDGLRAFAEARNRGISGFISMADAAGDIAMVECTPSDYDVFRSEGDWFAQANHARTEKMIPRDRGRSPDSFLRREAMEQAVHRHVGKITPEIAASILRDRGASPYINDSLVANLGVLNATVVHPASRILWHSTTMQPLAPFGEMVPFSVGSRSPAMPSLPADSRLGTPGMNREAAVVAKIRQAIRAFDQGKIEEAGATWDRLAAENEPLLEPHRLVWARARVRWALGRLDEADELLAGLDGDDAPFDVRAWGLAVRGVIADRLGRRDQAQGRYRQAQALIESRPEYNDQFFLAPAQAVVSRGLQTSQTSGPMPPTPDLQHVPS